MTTRMTQILILSLLGYAAGGLVLSLAVHLGSLAGFQPPGGNILLGGLHGGIFLLVLALMLISKMWTPHVKKDKWRLPVFPVCPAWMNYMTRGFYIYALMNFAVFFLMNLLSTGTPTLTMSHSFGAGDPSITTWRGFSSLWMVFYSTGLAMLTTALIKIPAGNSHNAPANVPPGCGGVSTSAKPQNANGAAPDGQKRIDDGNLS